MAGTSRSRSAFIKQSRLSLPIVQPVSHGTATPNLSGLAEPEKLRSLAGEIRQHTLDYLDHYLRQMRDSVARNAGHFHLATTARQARKRVIEALADEKCRQPRVERSLVINEIGCTAADTITPDALVTGANFAIAETGQVCLCHEAVPIAPLPRVIICVLGIESILPRLPDLAVMLKLLARSSIGRPMTASTQILGGEPKTAFHLICVDNGRSKILASEHRPALRCIGCGACSAACPVYQEPRRVGEMGHASPIAAIISPLMRGLRTFDQLPFASTLCGACSEICPVGIDLPWHLVRLRDALVNRRRTGWKDRFTHRLRAWSMKSTSRFAKLAPKDWRRAVPTDAPKPAAKSFRELWNQ